MYTWNVSFQSSLSSYGMNFSFMVWKIWVSFFFCLSITGDWGGLSHSHMGENFRRRKTESVWSKFAFEVVIVEQKSGPWIDPGAPRSKPEKNFFQVNLPCGFTEWPLPQTEFSDFVIEDLWIHWTWQMPNGDKLISVLSFLIQITGLT